MESRFDRRLWLSCAALLWAATLPLALAQQRSGVLDDDALYSPQDLQFLSHMIVHHEQALQLAAWVPERATREDLIRFARYVEISQRAEIEQMKSLLRVAADRGVEIHDHTMHMTGMLSRAQMAAIEAARGAQFERLWLEGMILHHQGALDMARVQQQHQFENDRRPFGIDVLLDDILVVQRAEITKMRAMLDETSMKATGARP